MTDEAKILGTALVTSFFTVCIIEPVKAWLQRRRVRKGLYREMIHNCVVLSAWVDSAKPHPEMQEHTAAHFASEYRKLAYELAVKDAGFYSLRGDEPYRIDAIYREFERISNGSYEDPQDCFLRAEVASAAGCLGCKTDCSAGVSCSASVRHDKKSISGRSCLTGFCTSMLMMRRDGEKKRGSIATPYCIGSGGSEPVRRLEKGKFCDDAGRP